MKRSLAISLTLMGAAVVLTGCNEEPIDTAIYNDVNSCVESGKYSRSQCEANYAEAKKQHEKNGPSYKSKDDCEAEFGAGKCEQTSPTHASGGNSFMPFMMGYMLGGTSSGGYHSPAQGLYRTTNSSNFMTGSGANVGNKTGGVRISGYSSAAKPSTSTTTLSRGGFGARAISVAG
ncbi:hypothetical protein phiOC_p242 [Ochrobactrum phage vB_OspM_OC]|nr:hypothetical protein phiOC_p242 [Ochrobactrum phage vB_OspM_OC]